MNNLALVLKGNFNRIDTDYLSSLQIEVEKLREKLYSYAKSIMTPLDSILVNHYQERLKCAKGQPMLGEYAPFIVADLFFTKPYVVDKLAFPWLLLYEYSLLLDDLLDDKTQSNWSHKLLLSQILLDSSIAEYKKIFGDNKLLWTAYDAYRRESINGIMNEIDWSKSKEGQSKADLIIQQGQKSALAKFCVTSIVYLDKNRLLTFEEGRGIDYLCAGIQLLDDLTDVLEDHRDGRRNVLLEDTYEWFKNNIFNDTRNMHPKDITDNQLIVGLVYSGAFGQTWRMSAEQIDRGLKLFNDKECQAAKYFKSISIKCRQSSNLIDNAISDMPELHKDFLRMYVEEETSKILNMRLAKMSEVWTEITNIINNGPKACQ